MGVWWGHRKRGHAPVGRHANAPCHPFPPCCSIAPPRHPWPLVPRLMLGSPLSCLVLLVTKLFCR